MRNFWRRDTSPFVVASVSSPPMLAESATQEGGVGGVEGRCKLVPETVIIAAPDVGEAAKVGVGGGVGVESDGGGAGVCVAPPEATLIDDTPTYVCVIGSMSWAWYAPGVL